MRSSRDLHWKKCSYRDGRNYAAVQIGVDTVKSKKPDVEFLTRTLMSLASQPTMERYSARHPVRVLLAAMLKEVGVQTPYPPIEDAA